MSYPEFAADKFLEKAAQDYPDSYVIKYLDHLNGEELKCIKYVELNSIVNKLAYGLRSIGLEKGTRVALFLSNSPELIAGYHAVWRSGGVVVPFNPMFTSGELQRQLKDSGSTICICSSILYPQVKEAIHGSEMECRISVVLTDGDKLTNATHDGVWILEDLKCLGELDTDKTEVDAMEELALLQYTGGTTGTPKGAMLTHRNIAVNVTQFTSWYAIERGAEICVAALPLFHIGGFSGAMMVPLCAAATILLMGRFNPRTVLQAIAKYRATRFFAVPTMYIDILNHPERHKYDLSSLRHCRTSAMSLPPSVKAEFDRLVGHEVLVEGYGLSETSPLTHANPIDRAKPGSIGIPLPHTDARIVDLETGVHSLPIGEVGELVVKGPQVMRGYWNNTNETKAVLKDGWLHTGDIARIDGEGYFYIVDRKKDVINTAGFKVWPKDVEDAIYQHPAVKMVAAIGVQDARRGEAVKVFISLKPSNEGIDAEEIIKFCRTKLARYKIPRLVEFRKELPISAAGKILRRVLREQQSSCNL